MDRPRCRIAECVGCGYCCETATCVAGLVHGSSSSPCDFLIFKDGRHWCMLVLEGVVKAEQLYIGFGCCSSLNTKRRDYIKELQGDNADKSRFQIRND
jgi:hypothetical protein